MLRKCKIKADFERVVFLFPRDLSRLSRHICRQSSSTIILFKLDEKGIGFSVRRRRFIIINIIQFSHKIIIVLHYSLKFGIEEGRGEAEIEITLVLT